MMRTANQWGGNALLGLLLLAATGLVACDSEHWDVGVHAWVEHDLVDQGDNITVLGRITADGRPVAGVPMETHWRYHTPGQPRLVERWCPAPGPAVLTDERGTAACTQTLDLTDLLLDDADEVRVVTVDIGVRFFYAGRHYWTETAFTPRLRQ